MKKILRYSKKFTKLVISFSFLFLYIPTAVFAADTVGSQVAYETSDMSWYDETKTEFNITTANELEGLSQIVNEGIADFTEKTVYLSNDIDIGGLRWTPIGHTLINISNGQFFMGTFDGQGHTVKNLTINENAQTNSQTAWGLFGFSDARIINLHVTGSIQLVGNAANYIGGIAGMVGGSIENSTSSVVISINGYVNTSSIGGIVGDLQSGGLILNSIFDGSINVNSTLNGNPYIGGIAGTNAGSTIKQSVNKGNIEVISGYGYAGGLVGQSYSESLSYPSVIDYSYNTGSIVFSEVAGFTGNASVGGLVGQISANGGASSITNSFTAGTVGTVTGVSKIGEIAGSEVSSLGGSTSSTNSYYIAMTGTTHTLGTAKTIEEMAEQSFVDLLNGSDGSFIISNTGLPILSHQGFLLTFVNGVGDSIYAEGMQIAITANAVPEGQWFLGWVSSNGGVFADKDSLSTTFTMPAANTTITAVFEIIPAGDYTMVDAAIANIPSNLTQYTDKTTSLLDKEVKMVIRDKNITEQTTIDSYATNINKAIEQLVYKDADYSKVDEALTAIPKDMSVYTTESVASLKTAVNAIIRNKNITEQELVDTYASNILAEIANLKLKVTTTPATPTVMPTATPTTNVQSSMTPDTSDQTNVLMIAAVIISSIGAIVILIKKRFKTE